MAILVARNADEAMLAPLVGSSGSLESDGRFCVGAFGRNLASAVVKMFSHLIYFKKKYKFCTLNAICKDNSAINCDTVQHKRGLFPFPVTGL
jgi:hypothetical protein